MVFFKKSGKEKTAQARSSQAPRTRPPAHPNARSKYNARASDSSTRVLVPSFEETIKFNTTKGEVAARHQPDNEKHNALPQLNIWFRSSNEDDKDIDSVFGGLSLPSVSVGREILPSSKDVLQTREPTSTRHGEDPSSSSRGRDNDLPSQTAQVQKGVKEQINHKYLQPQVKQFDPLSSQPQKSSDQPELHEKKSKSKKAAYFRDQVGSVGKDPHARTAASAVNKRSSKKHGRIPNKIASQDYDGRHSLDSRRSRASSLAANPNIEQTDHRDDNFDSVVNWNANNPNSQDEEFSVEYSSCDEDESVASTNAKIVYHQDDMPNGGKSTCWWCPIFQCNDDKHYVMTYITERETVATESVYHDGDEESTKNDCSIDGKSYLVNDCCSNSNNSASCSSNSDDTRTFLSESDSDVGEKKVDPPADEVTGWLFGCGQLDNEVKEEDEGTSMPSSDDGTGYTGQSDDGGSNSNNSASCSSNSNDTRTFLSESDSDVGEKKVDPPADEVTGWLFGCGQLDNEVKEEDEGTSMPSSDDGTGYTGQSDGGAGYTEQSQENLTDEKSLANGSGGVVTVTKEENDESNKTTIFRNRSSTTIEVEDYTTASVNGKNIAPDPPHQQKHDREGRLQLSSIPLNPVSSLTKSLKKLKGRGNGDKCGDKSISPSISITSSDKSMSMTPSNKSIRSTKSLINSPKNEKPMNKKVQDTGKFTVDKSLWDSDDRQQDLYCAERGGIENLTVRQYSSIPTPNAPDHVLVKVEASTASSRDCSVRASGDPNTAHKPFIPGFQAVGQVCAVGAEVDPLKIRLGDRVAALLPNGGGNAKYISIPVSWAMILPESASHDDIICLIANYMTAYQCLKLAKKDGTPLTNANVLITGGSEPVGQALIELALHEGANVYSTAHKMHEEHLTKLGTKWFSVKPEKWLPVLEGKMDVVVDNLMIDGYESSYRALTDNGILICNRVPEMVNDWSSLKAKFLWSRAIFYELHESHRTNPRLFELELHYLINKLQRGVIQPKVAGRVTLNQVPKAQQLIEKGLPNGTVICLPWKKLDPKQKVKVEKCG